MILKTLPWKQPPLFPRSVCSAKKLFKISSLLRCSLLQTHCCSWYGSQMWDINSKHVRQLSVEWNKAVRRTLRISYHSHKLLHLILNTSSFMDQHARRVHKFVCAFLTAQNDNILLIGFRTRDFVTGALGRNRARIESRKHITLPHETCVCLPATDEHPDAERVREPLDARDGVDELNGISFGDICFMIEHIRCAWYTYVPTLRQIGVTRYLTPKWGGPWGDCPGLCWRRWRLISSSPVTTGEGSSWRFVCSYAHVKVSQCGLIM